MLRGKHVQHRAFAVSVHARHSVQVGEGTEQTFHACAPIHAFVQVDVIRRALFGVTRDAVNRGKEHEEGHARAAGT